MRLSWASNSNEVYRIECADSLIDTNTGLTDWQPLYALHYPSQGTNTFWLDAGNYDGETNILHPKYSPLRFYRIASEGTNTGVSPYVSIDSPTNGSVLSDQVTISVTTTSSMAVVNARFFVDGQEMYGSDDGSNFVINTCEWGNGPHTLFATSASESDLPTGNIGSSPITIGRSVSSFVNVTFSNLITRVAFSQPFFEPSLGQTQEVTAVFGAPVDWTLQIIDISSNAVLTVTGSGSSMLYDWDGTGDGGTNIPDGEYHYVISASTNGSSFSFSEDEPMSRISSLTAEETNRLWVVSTDSSDALPLSIFPDGFDTNGLTIFEATPSEVAALASSDETEDVMTDDAASSAFSGPSAQTTTTPTRTPTAPIKNSVNSYAIGFYSFPNGPRTNNIPKNGVTFPATGVVHLDGCPTCNTASSDAIPGADMMAVNMIQEMKHHGWKLVFEKSNERLSVQSIRRNDQGYGGGEIFTQATLGLFLDHGSYGLDPDFSLGSSTAKNTYWLSGNPNDTLDNAWLRMCQFGFGGTLKWMAILACESLCDPNYNSMVSHGAIPLKTTHLLCGCETIAGVAWDVGANWSRNITSKGETIKQGWFDAAFQEFHSPHVNASSLPNPTIYRVSGYPECMGDTVSADTAPTSPSATPI